jgi:stage II sporulation protein M
MLLLSVAFGILPLFAVGFNGFLLGGVSREAVLAVGYTKTALHVLPHGVFEIPALLLAAAYGIWIGVAALQRVRGRGGLEIRFQLGYAIRRYVAVVVPLLLIAAAIETVLAVM